MLLNQFMKNINIILPLNLLIIILLELQTPTEMDAPSLCLISRSQFSSFQMVLGLFNPESGKKLVDHRQTQSGKLLLIARDLTKKVDRHHSLRKSCLDKFIAILFALHLLDYVLHQFLGLKVAYETWDHFDEDYAHCSGVEMEKYAIFVFSQFLDFLFDIIGPVLSSFSDVMWIIWVFFLAVPGKMARLATVEAGTCGFLPLIFTISTLVFLKLLTLSGIVNFFILFALQPILFEDLRKRLSHIWVHLFHRLI